MRTQLIIIKYIYVHEREYHSQMFKRVAFHFSFKDEAAEATWESHNWESPQSVTV